MLSLIACLMQVILSVFYILPGAFWRDVGPGEEGPDGSGRGGRGHVLDGDRGHLVHSQDDTPEEEEQDGAPQQVRSSCRGLPK